MARNAGRPPPERLFAVCLGLLVVTTACTVATAPSYAPISRTPAPLPSEAMALNLETASLAAFGPGPNWACAGSTPESVRVVRNADAVGFELINGGRIGLVWPRGFSARLLGGRAEIVAPDGSVVAREGDDIPSGELTGSSSGTQAEPRFDICGVNGVYYPPAS